MGAAHARLVAVFDAFAACGGVAYRHEEERLGYAALHDRAVGLAGVLGEGPRRPAIVYGHKSPATHVAYWACLIAGRPVVFVEADTPAQRVRDLAAATGADRVLQAGAAAPPSGLGVPVIDATDPQWGAHGARVRPAAEAADDDVAYVMSSSGTSGAPKAICVTYANLADFVGWLSALLPAEALAGAVTGNVRHCFDVSLFEMWSAWLARRPISALDHADFSNSRRCIERYAQDGVTLWVSTPTAIALYLQDPLFAARALPALKTFLFCGEVLPKAVVRALWERFPGSRVLNTYGPTECTVAVTSVEIAPAHVADPRPLPIGRARPGTRLSAEGGEIVIRGRSVGPGYLGLPERQARAFPAPGEYRTGDAGALGPDGLWYFGGRSDREIKLQGVRLDLNEIEEEIRGRPGVEAVIVEPRVIRGQARALEAYVAGAATPEALREIASAMALCVPGHMVPRFWFGCGEMRLNLNGKLDRAETIAAAQERRIAYVHA